jgi:hypothetical protein
MKNRSNTFRFGLIILLVLACCALAQAQSGRRSVPSAPPPPVPTPTPEPTPKPKQEEKEPEIFIVIGADQNSTAGYFPISYYDAVLQGCAEALRKGSSAGIDVMSRDLSRGEAIKKAKADQRTYVVVLVLSTRTMSGTQGSSYPEELEYTVFAPQTGKIATSGRTYQNANRSGPLIVGPPVGNTTSVMYREKLLRIAGEDAGERIVKALHLSSVGGSNKN